MLGKNSRTSAGSNPLVDGGRQQTNIKPAQVMHQPHHAASDDLDSSEDDELQQ